MKNFFSFSWLCVLCMCCNAALLVIFQFGKTEIAFGRWHGIHTYMEISPNKPLYIHTYIHSNIYALIIIKKNFFFGSLAEPILFFFWKGGRGTSTFKMVWEFVFPTRLFCCTVSVFKSSKCRWCVIYEFLMPQRASLHTYIYSWKCATYTYILTFFLIINLKVFRL